MRFVLLIAVVAVVGAGVAWAFMAKGRDTWKVAFLKLIGRR